MGNRGSIDSRLYDDESDDALGEYDHQNLVELFQLLCKLKQKQTKAQPFFSFDLAQACNLQTPSPNQGERNEDI